ncbi:MAG TPA: squalene--hopene cyclase [Gammaproteobacteria bacterium]|nr:squalene--hopene cyclase [Gammaproteobacteria bacterium]
MYDTAQGGEEAAIQQQVSAAVSAARVSAAVAAAREAILARQDPSGYWCYELEADCTIPAEYILMLRYLGEREPELETKLAVYLRRCQGSDGGWPLYSGGDLDISCSVKAYFALKMVGDDVDAPHMKRAREAILARGGAAKSNVFTRIALAMFGDVPWRAVPFIPIEFMLLPRWFPFHLLKVSYWSRTVMTPLAVLCSLKAQAVNPDDVHVRELFTTPPEQEKHYFPVRSMLGRVFLVLDKIGRSFEPLIPLFLRRRALKRAEEWIVPRLNGVGGLGAIFPAIVNAYEALLLLGYGPDHPSQQETRQAIRDLLVIREDEAYCQPCVSPVWDTGWTAVALQEDMQGKPLPALTQALDWLQDRQLLEEYGDWRETHPHLPGGGWAFQFRNDAYPDLDDTAVVAWAMHQAADRDLYAESIRRAADWLVGMQSRNGGFAAFDADNDNYYLNEIPFADHGALLDPPTEDVTGRVLTLLAKLDRPVDKAARERVLNYLFRNQTSSGAWFGRWGTNYIYGTWSVLIALEAAGVDPAAAGIRRAVDWLKRCQRDDGSWGETNDTYFEPDQAGRGTRGSAAQTAWALMGLMAAGEADSDAVKHGVAYLLRTQRDGGWVDPGFNAPGFPRVFYLKYHGYSHYFPYLALARYRNEIARYSYPLPQGEGRVRG